MWAIDYLLPSYTDRVMWQLFMLRAGHCRQWLDLLDATAKKDTSCVGNSHRSASPRPTINFGGGPGTLCWFFFNFMFTIWDSSHEDLQVFWLSFKHCHWHKMSVLSCNEKSVINIYIVASQYHEYLTHWRLNKMAKIRLITIIYSQK